MFLGRGLSSQSMRSSMEVNQASGEAKCPCDRSKQGTGSMTFAALWFDIPAQCAAQRYREDGARHESARVGIQCVPL